MEIDQLKEKSDSLNDEIKELIAATESFSSKIRSSKRDIERKLKEVKQLTLDKKPQEKKKSEKPNSLENNFSLAIKNIIAFGDTDIFPFSYESRLFEDQESEIIAKLIDIYENMTDYLEDSPPVNINTCSTVGYTGFRWATQIDPIWNAFYLGLCIGISESFESTRVGSDKVYSYRFKPELDKGSLFDTEINWKKFQKDSLQLVERSDEVSYVLSFDIADFYTRVYHHRLENALDRIDTNHVFSKKIMDLLQVFSGTTSYGLPVGGPASRILAELSLNAFDHLLELESFNFKRFVDDYFIFCSSEEDAHSKLTFISRTLMVNEGLTIQKQKTSIMSREEFMGLIKARINGVSEDEGSVEKARFMSLPIRFDPYSDDPHGDYEEIKKSLNSFDLLGMLASELQKSKIDQIYSNHLIKALQFKSEKVISDALILVFSNIISLYPIFIKIIQVTTSNWERLNKPSKEVILNCIFGLLKMNSFILQVELNKAFVCKLLGRENSVKNQQMLVDIYTKNADSMLIKSIVMQTMTKWNVHHWLSNLKNSFSTMNTWQRRIFIISSFTLGDEGSHWRDHHKGSFSKLEKIYLSWGAYRKNRRNIEDAL